MESAVIFALGVIVIAVGLMLSIALHEWGHFAPAKKFGVYIPQFMIGFGPTLFSRRRGETEFGVKAIPLGGYVAMAGMYAPGSPDSAGGTSTTGFLDRVIGDEPVVSDVSTNAEDIDRRSFYRLPLIQRITIMLGGPLMNLVIALVLYAVVLVGFGVPSLSLTVGSVSQCVVPASETRSECLPGDPSAPGAQAGLLPGDRIVSLEGESVQSWFGVTETIRASPGKTLQVGIERSGTSLVIPVTPLLSERYAFDDAGEIL
ncbi:MAG: peptidase, partial [Microbacteriaceae bacterium]|nr:peptidase [Microbacteriaceae bacterium]